MATNASGSESKSSFRLISYHDYARSLQKNDPEPKPRIKDSSPLHIVSAHLGELGLTLGQRSVDGKSNEIPAVQALLAELDISGCMIVADALNCQKETARTIVKGKGDYLLSVKDNQPSLKQEIEEYVRDSALRKTMEMESTQEKNRERIETRTAYVSTDVSWITDQELWAKLSSCGAIHTQFTTTEAVQVNGITISPAVH